MLSSALIGNTGFVGGNLLRQRPFDALFHSTDIDEIRGRHFDEVFCAGAPGVKWLASREPERDRASLERLMDALGSVRAERFVLISTVDVFATPVDVFEDTVVDPAGLGPYGLHRFELERFVRETFARSHVIRLPGVFGPGLRKNAIYDMLHDNHVERLPPEAIFQFYDLGRLAGDVEKVLRHDLEVMHLATEPVALGEVATRVFGLELVPQQGTAARYEMRSRHAALWNSESPYLLSREQVIDDLRRFVEVEWSPRPQDSELEVRFR